MFTKYDPHATEVAQQSKPFKDWTDNDWGNLILSVLAVVGVIAIIGWVN